jgi:hypothetical protein
VFFEENLYLRLHSLGKFDVECAHYCTRVTRSTD